MGSLPVTAEPHISSAAAFVEGGVQDPCEDSCSICLEAFCDSNPGTVTSCKHEYHLQCIIEWSQRSKECPMCWQPLSLKDPNSQELLDAVEQERPYRSGRQMPSIMQRNSMDEFEFHQVPSYADDSDFEERIMQHLAAAARAHHFARREMMRNRPSSVRDHPQVLVMPTHSPSSQVTPSGNFTSLSAVGPARVQPLEQLVQPGGQVDGSSPHTARSLSDPVQVSETNGEDVLSSRRERHNSGLEHLEEGGHQRTGSAELLSFSESLKSRFAAASSRYKETFTKTTRGFREKLRTRNNTMTDLGARAREVSAGVVRALERMSLETNGRSRGEDDVPTTSGHSGDLDRLPSLTNVESPSAQEATVRTGCTSNNLSGSSGTTDSVSQQPSSGDAGIGLDLTSSKDSEGSSDGGDAHLVHSVSSLS